METPSHCFGIGSYWGVLKMEDPGVTIGPIGLTTKSWSNDWMIWGLAQWLRKPPYRWKHFLTEGSHDQQISRCYSNAVRRSWNFQMEADRKLTSHHFTWVWNWGILVHGTVYSKYRYNMYFNRQKDHFTINLEVAYFETNPHVELKGEQNHATLHCRIQQGGFPFSTFSYILPIYGTPQAVARWIHPLKCQPEKDFRGRVRG